MSFSQSISIFESILTVMESNQVLNGEITSSLPQCEAFEGMHICYELSEVFC